MYVLNFVESSSTFELLTYADKVTITYGTVQGHTQNFSLCVCLCNFFFLGGGRRVVEGVVSDPETVCNLNFI